MPLANPIVARLKEKKPGWAAPDHCGLLLVTNWPASEDCRTKYSEMRSALAAALPDCAYLYPPWSLHCTVATLRAFTAGALVGEDREAEKKRWLAVLDAARAMPKWPKGSFRLRLGPPLLEGAAGIVKYEEIGGTAHIEAMRACMRAAIKEAGGVSAEGSADRSSARALPGAPKGEPAPHIPNIVHSTVLRWAAEPTEAELAAAKAAFKAVAATWKPIEIVIDDGCMAVYEEVPFMHVPYNVEQVFWRSEKASEPDEEDVPPSERSWISLILEAVVALALPFLMAMLVTATNQNRKGMYFYLPGKPTKDGDV